MRVLITGGTGLIGRALAAGLAADGHEVVVLSRRLPALAEGPARETPASAAPAGSASRTPASESAAPAAGVAAGLPPPPAIRTVVWDGRTAAGWGALADGAGAIVHLAGENVGAGRWTAARKRALVASRLDSGAAVVAAIERVAVPPPVLVQASGISIYGAHGDEPVTEETPVGDGFLARLAVDWEASTAAVERRGVRRALLRTGLVLARDGGALPRLLLPFRLFAGGPLGDGHQGFPWIHLADQIAAIRFLLARADLAGAFNVVAPEALAQRELARRVGRLLRRPSGLPAPAFALRLLLGEMAELLLVGQRAVPARLLAAGFTFRFPEIEAALRDLLRSR